jgi:thymidylate synthase (FAD)
MNPQQQDAQQPDAQHQDARHQDPRQQPPEQQADAHERLIERTPPEGGTLVDVMGGSARWSIPIPPHGLIALVDVMPRLVPEGHTADAAIVQAARVSYGAGTKRVNEDRGLIRYLMRHAHSTPFEMVELKFHVAMPIFVARQWIRHRTANVNEYSARYSLIPEQYWTPTEGVRAQSAGNRQGSQGYVDPATAEEFLAWLERSNAQHTGYERLIDQGVSRELARTGLPVSAYTQWYWKCDLHNIFHFLALRMDEHAQKEIRDYALAMFALIRPLAPVACEAFVDYRLQGMRLSRLEIEAIRSGQPIDTANKREQSEFEAKRGKLGL